MKRLVDIPLRARMISIGMMRVNNLRELSPRHERPDWLKITYKIGFAVLSGIALAAWIFVP